MEASRPLVIPKVPADRIAPCSTCEHTDFIHSDFDERSCLYSGCECASYSVGLGGSHPAAANPAAIVATKRGNTITLALSAGDSIERAATLARLGWSVRVARAE